MLFPRHQFSSSLVLTNCDRVFSLPPCGEHIINTQIRSHNTAIPPPDYLFCAQEYIGQSAFELFILIDLRCIPHPPPSPHSSLSSIDLRCKAVFPQQRCPHYSKAGVDQFVSSSSASAYSLYSIVWLHILGSSVLCISNAMCISP